MYQKQGNLNSVVNDFYFLKPKDIMRTHKDRDEMVGTVGNTHVIVGKGPEDPVPKMVLLGKEDAENVKMISTNRVTKIVYYMPKGH